MDPIIVGEVLAGYRKKKGISQEVLSGLAAIGRTHLSAIERGERRPTIDTFYRICKALDVRPGEVFDAIDALVEENH
ncbi:MAG: helix-turn-helix transcriptional regulator [Clostridia bacterium]|nr:helix-turn-helix transcriptional regulator [Clostridia bacterium]